MSSSTTPPADVMAAMAWQRKNFDASKYFTPNTPVDEKELFAGRISQINRIVDVINQKGLHAIVYGERGVGKTSLMNVLKSFLSLPSVISPRINCDSSDTFASVWTKAFELVDLNRQLKPPAGFTGTGGQKKFSAKEMLQGEVSPNTVRNALNQLAGIATTIFIIDEFDRLNPGPRRAFADTIKALSDHAVNATVILVGVADNVEQLIAEHQSVERALSQIQMPRMSSDEIKQIVVTGAQKLEMTASDAALKHIARLSQGLPHYAHLLGLYAVRESIAARSNELTANEVRAAIAKAIANVNQSIRTSYETAIRSARKDNLFADVLLACSLAKTSDLGYFAAQDVREPLRMITGKSRDIPSFAQHLNEFCDAKRGPILSKTGSPRLYRFRFINPLFQPFVIMQGIQNNRISPAMLDAA
jgi:Cdc6-like AAA superfamily ATPase